MISLYVPGTSLVHRCPAGAKLIGLAAVACLLALLPSPWTVMLCSAVLPPACYALARLGPRVLLRDLWSLRLLLLFLAVTQLVFLGPLPAAVSTLRVLGVVLLAQCLTRTTRTSAMVQAVQTALAPLRRFGLRPERVGLAMALAVTSIGQVAGIVDQVRQAQKARGVRLAPWSWVMPVLVLSLRHADDVADALDARGQG